MATVFNGRMAYLLEGGLAEAVVNNAQLFLSRLNEAEYPAERILRGYGGRGRG
jgi:hypothetical protein